MTERHHQHNHGRCEALFARLSEYLDNELDAGTRGLIEAHLQDCRPCQVCLQTLKRTVALCRTLGNVPVPEGFSKRLKAIVAARERSDEPGSDRQ